MSRDLNLYLDDILNSINKIERVTADISTQEAFVKNEKTFDAVTMNLQIIGESVKHVPEEYKEAYPQVDWKDIVGLRDFIAHVYFSLDDEIIWNTVQNDLAGLKECIVLMKKIVNANGGL